MRTPGQIRLITFAKAPQPGLAKTRLIPALGAVGAAALAEKMLFRTLESALAAASGVVELCVTPELSTPVWRDYQFDPAIVLSEQGSGDLGMRLARAAQRGLLQSQAVMLIGTDCPDLNADRIRAAAAALATWDAVMHPTADGGYALLGLRRFHPRIFENIAWSTETVAQATLARLREVNFSVQLAEPLRDIDTPDDLVFLPPELRSDF